jgi:CheY-like chemotaxis protein
MAKKILLVDDDSDDREFFCEAVEEIALDILCYTANDGRQAITEMDKKTIEIPDLMFLDINMPIMSGWQCLSILKEREEYKTIPVVMYSTSSHAEDITKAQQLGALCLFSKPQGYKDLKNGLEQVLTHLMNDTLSSLSSVPAMVCSGQQ